MNLKQQTFVTEYLRLKDKVMAYKLAYNRQTTNYNTLESAANRLLRNPEIAEAIRSVMDSIRCQVEAELKEEMRTELLSLHRKRELLAQIAEGDIYVEQNFKGRGCNTCTVLVRPAINQRLKAIHLDNQLAGHYGKKDKAFSHPALPGRTEQQYASVAAPWVAHCKVDSETKGDVTSSEKPQHPDSYRDTTKARPLLREAGVLVSPSAGGRPAGHNPQYARYRVGARHDKMKKEKNHNISQQMEEKHLPLGEDEKVLFTLSE